MEAQTIRANQPRSPAENLKGGELLERRAAVVEFEIGKGRLVLIGFRAQHRAQPHRTFRLLFNALYGLAGP